MPGTSISRKKFLLDVAGLFGAAKLAAANGSQAETQAGTAPKVLLVVAHPDDEYTFAATTYRIARELGGVVDQVVITDGAGGYRYSSLAERIYGVSLTNASVGRANLPAIRKRETLAAGRILGIRKHYFLGQPDQGFTLDAEEGLSKLWNASAVERFVHELLLRERYQFVFTLLPTEDTHGHHKAATLLALKAAEAIPQDRRPAVLGADPAAAAKPPLEFSGNRHFPDTEIWPGAPVFAFDRRASFGPDRSLSYQIVVNWMIAEHKSQGLFQTDFNRHDLERFWLFRSSGANALESTTDLFRRLDLLS